MSRVGCQWGVQVYLDPVLVTVTVTVSLTAGTCAQQQSWRNVALLRLVQYQQWVSMMLYKPHMQPCFAVTAAVHVCQQ